MSVESTATRHGPLDWFATSGALIVAAVFLTDWPKYHYVILGGPLALVYYVIPGLLVIPLLAIQPETIGRLLRQPMIIWFVAYVITGLLWLLIAGEFQEDANRQWRQRILACFFFVTGLILTWEADRRKLAWMIVVCAALAAADNWLDFLYPFHFVPPGVVGSNPGRGAGFFIDANQAGHAIIIMAIAAMPFLAMRYRALCVVLMFVGVFPTFSRSAWVYAAIVAVLWLLFGQLNRKQLVYLFGLLPILATFGLALYEFGIASEYVNIRNIEERIDFFVTGGEVIDYSSEEREYVADKAWHMFTDNPLVGNGTGTTVTWDYDVSTHNMYLLFLAEQGIVGGALYLSFIFIILAQGVRLARRGLSRGDRDVGLALAIFGSFYVFIGLFSHTILEEPQTLFLLAFLCAAAWNAATNADSSDVPAVPTVPSVEPEPYRGP